MTAVQDAKGTDAVVGSNKYGIDATLFTRGGPGMADTRGESMVQKHERMLQKTKEDVAQTALQRLLPHFGPTVCTLALQQCNWSVEVAAKVLRQFGTDKDEDVKHLHKKRKRVLDEVQKAKEAAALAALPIAKAAAKAAAAAAKGGNIADSESDSDDDSSSSDNSGDDRRSRKKKRSSSRNDKKKRSSKSKDKGRSKDRKGRSSKDKDREKQRKRKSKGGDGDAGKAKAEMEYGKHGIIKETDFANVSSEFNLWALDVRKVNVETLTKFEELELYRDFMEDYNTSTLPHRKYYSLEMYEREKAQKEAARAAKSGKAAAPAKFNPRDDEAELRKAREAERAAVEQARMLDAYKALKYSDKAKDMKEQEMMRLQMSLAYRTGDEAKARKLAERLKPEAITVAGTAMPPKRKYEELVADPTAKPK